MPDDVILATSNSQVSVRGSVVINSTGTGFTFVKTATASALGAFNPASGLLAAGNYTVTLRSFSAGSSGFQDALGGSLDGTNSGIPGANFQITFAVSTPPVAVGIPDFARGPSNTDAIFFSHRRSRAAAPSPCRTPTPLASPTSGHRHGHLQHHGGHPAKQHPKRPQHGRPGHANRHSRPVRAARPTPW